MSDKPRLYRIFESGFGISRSKSSSENKDMIDVLLKFRLAGEVSTYRRNITWKNLIETKGLLPDDIIHDIDYVEEKGGGFGWMSEEEPPTYQVPYILISRRRIETDEEYTKRIRQIQKEKESAIEQEKQTYLKLHAKYGVDK